MRRVGHKRDFCVVEDFAETPAYRHFPLSPDESSMYFAGREALYALNAHSGEQIWRKSYVDHQMYSSTPAILLSSDGKRVYSSTSTNELNAIIEAHDSEDGALLWKATLDAKVMCFLPMLDKAGDNMYVSASGLEGGMLKFDTKEGDLLWNSTIPFPGRYWGIPALSKDERAIFVRVQYRRKNSKIKIGREEIHALDTKTGELLWVYSDLDSVLTPSYVPVVHPDGKELLAWTQGEILYGIDTETGKKLWEYTPGYRIHAVGFSLDGETIYFGDSNGGILHAMNYRTHKEKWSFRTTMNAWSWLMSLSGHSDAGALAVSSDGKTIFVGNSRGNQFAVDAETGQSIWEKDLEGAVKGLLPAHSGKDGLLYVYHQNTITAVTEEQTFLAEHVEL
eukprot:CAMPEP_0197858146 /NCGR_PEP_ID=MMETSP1438-20131217/31738_1 /TAXON_ID=1461541 /ORGANISM="Pterosperma sp., Strain CCMP1384" /LENGTH=391 /DNA_ID=CAMNT_0043474211 /DNA_START=316 /DNA_END=1491 /DNA_ORIENTATION=-